MSITLIRKDELKKLEEIKRVLEDSYRAASSNEYIVKRLEQIAEVEGETLDEAWKNIALINYKVRLTSDYQELFNHWIQRAEIDGQEAKQILASPLDNQNKQQLASEIVEESINDLMQAWTARGKKFEIYTEIVNRFWNYLPLEVQNLFEEWAKELVVEEPKLVQDNQNPRLRLVEEETLKSILNFTDAVFENYQSNLSKLKLEVLGTERRIDSIEQEEKDVEDNSIEKALALVRKWLKEDSKYDQENYPQIEAALRESRTFSQREE
jgi:hypothetical protein